MAKFRGQAGQLFVGGVNARVSQVGRLMDDEVARGQPLDQGWVEGCIGAKAQRAPGRFDAKGRCRDGVDRPSALDRKRAQGNRFGIVKVDQLEIIVQFALDWRQGRVALGKFHTGCQ